MTVINGRRHSVTGSAEPAATTRSDLVELLARVAARDRAAFSRLYHATSAKLYGVILRILSRRDVADEILQEVYVRIWERAGDFDADRASPITWMATIARNRAVDEVRRRTPLSLDEAPEALDVPDGLEHPLARMERSEDLQRLLKCLNGLDRDRREMVLLAYYHGMSREGLGRRFSRPAPTIKTWLYRSLAQLRDCLAQ